MHPATLNREEHTGLKLDDDNDDLFIQVILSEKKGQFDLRCYMMPNEPVDPGLPLHQFMIPIETIERAAGMLAYFVLTLFSNSQVLKSTCRDLQQIYF